MRVLWSGKRYPVSRYAAVLHSLTVIPYTALLPLSAGDNGERRSQARTVAGLLYHLSIPFYMNKEQKTSPYTGHSEVVGAAGNKKGQEPEADGKQIKPAREPRKTTVSFRVSRTQREHIGELAHQCGMTLSDYVLARSYNYRPKARLTLKQEAVRDELIMARSDYARYTSMLNAMPQQERRAMFRNQSWMVGALRLLGRTAEAVTKIIDRYFAPNRIPETPIIQEQGETTETEEAT